MKKYCSQEGCANQVQKGGLCWNHGSNSLATALHKVKCPHQLSDIFKAMTVSDIARKDREIGVDYLQTSMITAAAHQLPSPCPSATTLDSSDDEELSAWIYKKWCCFR
jgi:hypothetical protein